MIVKKHRNINFKKHILILLLIIFPGVPLLAQTGIKVTGKVINMKDKAPLEGVTISIEGHPLGTSTDSKGSFKRYKIVDPSFHNWYGLAMCLRGQAISDFPICNKSFNLSYCGFDL